MDDGTEDRRPAVRLDVGFTTALLLALSVAGAFLLTTVIGAAARPLGWALACATVALLAQPVIAWLDRHMKRGFAVLLTIVGIGILLGGAWIGVVNTVSDNVTTLQEQAPEAAAELEQEHQLARDFRLEERVTTFVDELEEDLGVGAQLRRSTSTASTYLVTGVLTVFFIVYGERLAAGALRQIRDEDRRARVARISRGAVHSWRRYSLRAIAEVVVVAIVSWIVLYAIGLPAPFVLGLAIGGFAVIPDIGILIGGLPAVLFAAADGLGSAVAVTLLVIGLEVVEVVAARHRSAASDLHLGPALPLIVGLISFHLYGLGGVIYGVLLLILAAAVLDQLAIERGDPTSAQLAAGTPPQRIDG